VLASQSRTVLSTEPEASTCPFGEKATDRTEAEWPSSVKSALLQSSCPFGFLSQAGMYFLNCFRIILFSGAKMRAEWYSWRGAVSIADRLYRANRFASWTNS
jgi:hypothetical protein